ncbi:DUF6591 domain-containing protein [Adlercreutzia sp. ZJ304]|uniref:DUF6591 domain-containing protein n=1 Tax=Adlercreutzia sp. ZJ304 TaxID=2709791 RepID=UPI0013EA7D5F|nr:DUF6591 domain-containing protein [Adlercreutzia sp. ZJ304]
MTVRKSYGTLIIKTLAIATAILTTLALLAGCSQGQTSESQTDTQTPTATPAKDLIKEDQIKWEVGSAIIDNYRRVVFSYTNNSDRPIANVKMVFKLSENATNEEINAAYGSIYGWGDIALEALKNNGIWGEASGIVEPAQTSLTTRLELGAMYLTDMAQYDLTEPEFMIITYIDNNKLYEETYDYVSDTYSLSNNVEEYAEWPDNEFAKTIPEITGKYITDIYSYETSISFEVNGVTSEEYQSYTKQCAEAGYSDPNYTNYSYYADSSDGKYRLNLNYNDDDQSLRIEVDLKKTE